MSNNIVLNGLARRLINDKLLSEDEIVEHIKACEEEEQTLAHYLVAHNILEPTPVAVAASHEFGTPLYDLDSHNPDFIPRDIINEKLVIQHQVLPLLKRGKRLFVAMVDPTNLRALDDIKFNTGHSIEAVLVEANKLTSAIEQYLHEQDHSGSLGNLDDEGLENIDVESTTNTEKEDPISPDDEAPIVKFVNKILLDAIRKGASDIHFEPYEKSTASATELMASYKKYKNHRQFSVTLIRAIKSDVGNGYLRTACTTRWPH